MNAEELIYTIALTQVEGVGVAWARNLIQTMGSAKEVFTRHKELPKLIPGATERLVEALENAEAISRAEKEFEFIQTNHMRCLTVNDEKYPSRLRECEDAPVVLFYKGNADLNTLKVISIVGTRNATDYGKELCSRFMAELKEACPDNVLIVSGLAYGIDIHAHRAALQYDFPTVGVLAHGLDRIYPHAHRRTAIEMLQHGGLLTEFLTETNPDRYNFVSRNRIVAGMSDAVIVVESGTKGGSLITADLAGGYNRDCFAFPGRTMDAFSQGCNRLIRDQKAALIESAHDVLKFMRWDANSASARPKHIQRQLFLDVSEEERKVIDALLQENNLHINNLLLNTGIPIQRLSALLFEMEMKGMLKVLAGSCYQLLQ